MMTTLTTQRLVLRPYRAEDEAPFVELVTDDQVMAFMSGALSVERAREKLRTHIRFGAENIYAWAVEHQQRYVGHAFLVWRREEASWELGYIIVPACQGNGLGTEAAAAVLAWAKAQDKRPVIATVDIDHRASQRVAEKIGLAGPVELSDEEGPYYCYRTA